MVVLIGVDCATQPRKVGLACCTGNAKTEGWIWTAEAQTSTKDNVFVDRSSAEG